MFVDKKSFYRNSLLPLGRNFYSSMKSHDLESNYNDECLGTGLAFPTSRRMLNFGKKALRFSLNTWVMLKKEKKEEGQKKEGLEEELQFSTLWISTLIPLCWRNSP